ncbi:uncharacterized protein NPIL_643181 [Nephila pilipes]|uniref:Uncharacterized protein n=1 Tax=Nephila pilipes TaxID=299642 RepID=A0A8X6QNS2_NEPPI|nr:uncharacterized protein NPIL_643181 [Nephila pilipes]
MQLPRNIGVFIPSAASHPVTTYIPRLLFVFLRWSGLLETLLYCILCLRCTTLIRKLAQEINPCSPEAFGPGEQFSILRRKSEIDCILDIIQDIFSLPSFFVVFSSFLSLYRVLAFNLTSRVIHHSSLTATVSLFYGVTVFFCFTSILWVAGGVPVELNKLKEKFYKKVLLRFIVLAITKEPKYKQEILEAPEFVQTGSGILSYRKSCILTLVGTLLMYTVLIINTI